MARKKLNLALVANESARAISLKKRRLGLVKKVRELTILCDVKACLIISSPKDAEPMAWPSRDAARDLLNDYFALPEFERKKKEMSHESYLTEKTMRVREQLRRTQKKNMEYAIDQLMMQLNAGRGLADLNLNEIYSLLSFLKHEIMHLRTMLDFMHHSPLRDPPVYPSEAQFEDLRTTTNEVLMIEDGQNEDTTTKTDDVGQRISIGTLRENKSYYLMDQWFFPPSGSPNSQMDQQTEMEMACYNESPDPRCSHPYGGRYQGSSSNGNPNMEMEPIVPPMMMTFQGLAGPLHQRLQHHHNMNDDPMMVTAMSQPRLHFMCPEEQSNINVGNSQFHRSTNTMTTIDGLRQEPPPLNEATVEEDNVDATSLDINREWPGINNHHF